MQNMIYIYIDDKLDRHSCAFSFFSLPETERFLLSQCPTCVTSSGAPNFRGNFCHTFETDYCSFSLQVGLWFYPI